MVFGQIYQVFELQKDNSLRNVSYDFPIANSHYDQTLEQHATEKAAAEEKIQTLQGQVDNAQTEREEAVANREKELNEAHEQAIANLNEEHNQAIEKLNTEHTEALQTEKDAREKAEGEA